MGLCEGVVWHSMAWHGSGEQQHMDLERNGWVVGLPQVRNTCRTFAHMEVLAYSYSKRELLVEGFVRVCLFVRSLGGGGGFAGWLLPGLSLYLDASGQELSIARRRGGRQAGRPLCSSAVLITNTHLPTSSRVVEIGVGSESDIGPVNTNRDPGEEMGWNVEFQPGVASIPRWAVQLSNLPYHPTQHNPTVQVFLDCCPINRANLGLGLKSRNWLQMLVWRGEKATLPLCCFT